MRWLYDTKNRRITNLEDLGWVKLSELEAKLLQVLLNHKLNSWGDIITYVYKDDQYYYTDIYTTTCLTKSRLLQKVKLNIKCLYGERTNIKR